ncbi:hypothetical protein ACP4OV_000139 [Aristida adscensionis]
MEKGSRGPSCRAAVCGIVALLGATAFFCSLAAEFRKVKEKDMKLDGSLCSLPRSAAFELGVAAVAFLFVAQLVGTTAAAATVCAAKPKKSSAARGPVAFVALLVLSCVDCDADDAMGACRVTFAVAAILLATAASMNRGQRYGRGWMDGDCYVARTGVFAGAAALVAVTALLVLALTFATEPPAAATTASCAAASAARSTAAHRDAEQPGGRSKQ